MLRTVFRFVLALSGAGSVVTALLLLLRPITQRVFDQTWRYRMCILAMMFFLLPVGIAGNSLHPRQSALSNRAQKTATAALNMIAPLPAMDNVAADEPAQTTRLTPVINTTPLNIGLPLIPHIWLAGAAFSVCANGFRYVRFRRKLIETGLPVEDKRTRSLLEIEKTAQGVLGEITLLTSDIITTPMLTGISRAFLVLPEVEANERELCIIFKHELIHYRRRDLWVKALMLMVEAIHWFNPVVYLLAKQIETSCELSCDEQVVRDMSVENRHFYAETILNMLGRVAEKQISVCANLAKTKRGIERRLTFILEYKKMNKKMAALSVAIAMLCALAGCTGATSVSGVAGTVPSEVEGDPSAVSSSVPAKPNASDLQVATTSPTADADVTDKTVSNTVWVWPVEGCDVVFATFGTRYHPVEKVKTFNDNIQITGEGIKGASVCAALTGTVSEVGFDDDRGNYIVIDHGEGIQTFYMHLDKSLVSVGDPVAASDVIGTVGSTGKATAPFLAFAVRINGIAVNPLDYLES